MKTILIVNFIIILSYYTCQKEIVPLNETVELKYKVTKTFDDSGIKLVFDSVADSRCPTDVVCVWEGNAAVSFKFTNSNKETRFVLNTHGGLRFRTDTLISGYHIKLVNINRLNPPYNPEEYKAEVLITNK